MQQHGLICPDRLTSSAEHEQRHPHWNETVRLGLRTALLRHTYEDDDMFAVSNANAGRGGLTTWLQSLAAGTGPEEVPVEFGSELWRRKRRAAIEFILCIILRTRSSKVMPFMLVCVGIVALQTRLSSVIWSILSLIFILPAKTTVENICKDVSAEIALEPPDSNANIKVVVLDNMSSLEAVCSSYAVTIKYESVHYQIWECTQPNIVVYTTSRALL